MNVYSIILLLCVMIRFCDLMNDTVHLTYKSIYLGVWKTASDELWLIMVFISIFVSLLSVMLNVKQMLRSSMALLIQQKWIDRLTRLNGSWSFCKLLFNCAMFNCTLLMFIFSDIFLYFIYVLYFYRFLLFILTKVLFYFLTYFLYSCLITNLKCNNKFPI